MRVVAAEPRQQSLLVMCYVGKATKIFFVALAVLVVVSLVLALALIIQRLPRNRSTGGHGASSTTYCDQGNSHNVACSPLLLPDPGASGVPASPSQPSPAVPGPVFPSKLNFS